VIAASKWRPFARWFARRAEARMRAAFGSLRVEGIEHLVRAAETGPVLCVANHSSWWDGLVALVVSQRVPGRDAYALMDARRLAELRFFSLAGGIGVEIDSARDGALALRHAAALLDRPGRVLWWFPQGRESPSHAPLRFRPGAARLAGLVPAAAIVPIGLRYRFAASARPDACVSIGPALALASLHPRVATAVLEQAVAHRLDRIDEPTFAGESWWCTNASALDRGLACALDAIAGLVLRVAGGRLQAAIGSESKVAIAPAHTPDEHRPSERGEEQRIGQCRIHDRGAQPQLASASTGRGHRHREP
jgi:1-acyl-sn-glycerol-3-phosphate acyltransferase